MSFIDRVDDDFIAHCSKNIGSEPTVNCCFGNCLISISQLTLLVVGIISVCGAMPLSTASYLTIGFGGGMMVGSLCSGQLDKRRGFLGFFS